MESLKKLSKYSICDISDGLVSLGIKDGGYIPNLVQQSTTKTAIAPAYTVLYAPKDDPRPAIKTSYIDSVPKDLMVVIGLPYDHQMINAPYTTINNAMYGGLMSTRANYRGAQGLIILGRIRDRDEHNNLQYPVWSYGIGSTAPVILKVVGINVPLEIKVADYKHGEAKVVINPGDIIMGDSSGVVSFDGNLTEQLLQYIPKRVHADEQVAHDITQGRPAKEAQDFWRSKI